MVPRISTSKCPLGDQQTFGGSRVFIGEVGLPRVKLNNERFCEFFALLARDFEFTKTRRQSFLVAYDWRP